LANDSNNLSETNEEVIDEDELLEAADESTSLSYFGTDLDVSGLVRRLKNGDIVVPNFDPQVETGSKLHGFQRKFVWKKQQMDRFIESLLIGYPVPGIFLVQEKNNVLLVLDGQQRLKTLEEFYLGDDVGKPFELSNVSKIFKGLTYDKLEAEDRRKLDNTFIHATIVKYNPDDPEEREGVYQVFERLNSSGTILQPHEIRVALSMGPFVELLRDLNEYSSWRELYGKISPRLRDQELILRFFALLEESRKYSRPLKVFLNNFLEKKKMMTPEQYASQVNLFQDMSDIVLKAIGKKAFKPTSPQVNAAIFDSVAIGIATRLKNGPIADYKALAAAYERLLSNDKYEVAVGRSTADEEQVRTRLRLASEAFNVVK